jgi:hypothetical protein
MRGRPISCNHSWRSICGFRSKMMQRSRLAPEKVDHWRWYSSSQVRFSRPYSGSLPSPGYEWCTRCNIRCHKFQKNIGQHNACLESPRLFGLGICGAAKNYWKQQRYKMTAFAVLCFYPISGSLSEERNLAG